MAGESAHALQPGIRRSPGRPWSERKKYVWWDPTEGRWTGYDVPDFPVTKAPDYRAPADATGMDAISGDDPFIMMVDGRGWLYSPSGLLDGPLPTHYEPLESPVAQPAVPGSRVRSDPRSDGGARRIRTTGPAIPRYPVVATTFRLTEHHTAGGMSRTLPWLSELQPEMFAAIDPILAGERGIEDGGWMTIFTERAEIEARALVTDRMRPLRVNGSVVHQVGLPWHWGYSGADTGDSVNDLGALSGEPNVSIQESKAFTCDVRSGRRLRPSTERLKGVVSVEPPVSPDEDDRRAEYPKEVKP